MRSASTAAGRGALAVVLALLAAGYSVSYLRSPDHPTAGSVGWWAYTDQGLYLRAARAWAAGNLAGGEHWYPPGYALLGAPFVWVTPSDPFIVPNLLLLLAACLLCGAILVRLAPSWPGRGALGARVAGAATVLLAMGLQRWLLKAWVVPWTTTASAALTLGCVVAVMEFVSGPRAGGWRPAMAAALCGAGIAAFRPSEAVVVCVVAGGAIGLRVLLAWPGWRQAGRVAAAGVAPGVAVAAALAGVHLVLHGFTLGGYLGYSAYIGFEWRNVPLQWVTLVLDPRPFLEESPGLVGRFPWIATGLAGVAACLIVPPLGGARARHAVVAAMMAAHVVTYLAYRDLHAPGMWRYLNYHYFKWVLAVLALYSVLLVACWRERRGGAAAGGALALGLLCWRLGVVPVGSYPVAAGTRLRLPDGIGLRDVLVAPAAGSFGAISQGPHRYAVPLGAPELPATGRLVSYKVEGGVMLLAVAPLPAGAGEMVFAPGVEVETGEVNRLRLVLVPGLPCFTPRWLFRPEACRTPIRVPG